MWYVLFDASALSKRYVPEPGSDTVDDIFDAVAPEQMLCLALGAAEVASVILRQRNQKRIPQEAYEDAIAQLLAEVFHNDQFGTMPLPNTAVEAALPVMEKHALNATDACLLHIALETRRMLRVMGRDLVLVASDDRLVRAAKAEGLPRFDPARQPISDLCSLLAGP